MVDAAKGRLYGRGLTLVDSDARALNKIIVQLDDDDMVRGPRRGVGVLTLIAHSSLPGSSLK